VIASNKRRAMHDEAVASRAHFFLGRGSMSLSFESLLAGTARSLSWFHLVLMGSSILASQFSALFSAPDEKAPAAAKVCVQPASLTDIPFTDWP